MTNAQKKAMLSAPSKPSCKAWSTRAGATCPFSLDADGNVVPICKACFAKKGRYVFPNVKDAQDRRDKDAKKSDWIARMITAIEKDEFFRWFDSGDINTVERAEAIFEVMKATPNVKHWLPTRSYKDLDCSNVLTKMVELGNVSVRCSSDDIGAEFKNFTNDLTAVGGTSLVVADPAEIKSESVHVCPATTNKDTKTCAAADCRACWDTEIEIVAYKLH